MAHTELFDLPVLEGLKSFTGLGISPDGKYIVVRIDEQIGTEHTHTIAGLAVASNQLTPLNIRGRHTTWDPSAQRLAYDYLQSGDYGNPVGAEVYVFDTATGTNISIGPGWDPSWASSGNDIAVRNNDSIQLVNMKTRMRRTLFAWNSHLMPVWSPDGRWMVYSRKGTPKSFLDGATEPQTIVLRDTRTATDMTLGDVAGKGNPMDYTWVTNAPLCEAGGGQ